MLCCPQRITCSIYMNRNFFYFTFHLAWRNAFLREKHVSSSSSSSSSSSQFFCCWSLFAINSSYVSIGLYTWEIDFNTRTRCFLIYQSLYITPQTVFFSACITLIQRLCWCCCCCWSNCMLQWLFHACISLIRHEIKAWKWKYQKCKAHAHNHTHI